MTSPRLRAPGAMWEDADNTMVRSSKSYAPIYGLTGILHVQMSRHRSNTSGEENREFIFFTRHRASPRELGLDRVEMGSAVLACRGLFAQLGQKGIIP